ncbi:hypothetical protein ACH5RR_013319 [Cinchona calisaya]|uniref:Uncharacterized protein n=1 Tax=Cinchona calisaya TaxID=153742 RepID=A0ABD3A2C9_9GENT
MHSYYFFEKSISSFQCCTIRKLKGLETRQTILQEALNLGMSVSIQVQFANIQSQYILESSLDNVDNDNEDGHHSNLELEDREDPVCTTNPDKTTVPAADYNDDDDEDVDDTFNYIMQCRDPQDLSGQDSEATEDDDAPAKKLKREEHSKKKNDLLPPHSFSLNFLCT